MTSMYESLLFSADEDTKRDNASAKVSSEVNSEIVNYDYMSLDYDDLAPANDTELDILSEKPGTLSGELHFAMPSRTDFQEYVRMHVAFEEEKRNVCEEESSCGCAKYKYKNCIHLWELVNHDCMWTGLCVNRDHRDSNSMLNRKSESRFVAKVSPGKSLLIPKQQSQHSQQPQQQPQQQQQQQHQQESTKVPTINASTTTLLSSAPQTNLTGSNPFTDSLSSDGDSLRPDTPLSSDSDGELDCFQGNIFKHDDLCFDSLLECKSVPMCEVLSPKYYMSYSRAKWVNDKKKEEEKQHQAVEEELMIQSPKSVSTDDDDEEEDEDDDEEEDDEEDDDDHNNNIHNNIINNNIINNNNGTGRLETETAQTTCPVISKEQTWKTTLSDHCYHINKPEEPSLPMIHKKMDNLGVQTPSDSEEEIDVVSFDKPTRATATLPTYPQSSQQQQYQRMMDTALRQKTKQQQHNNNNHHSNHHHQLNQQQVHAQHPQQQPQQAPRQRGRPKGSTARKRNAQAAEMSSQSNANKRSKPTRPYNRKNGAGGGRQARAHDSESDSERRSTHNNMERTRRSQLKSHFEFLRRQVPAIENNEKAAKVEILRQSRSYILTLEAAYKEGEEQCNMLRARQMRLKNRLSIYRRELAAKGWNIGHHAE